MCAFAIPHPLLGLYAHRYAESAKELQLNIILMFKIYENWENYHRKMENIF